ncbi:hypothetical protein AVEN_101557-1 [Araneus ventricosus]|uniref:Uncharacterized protein n=1 Tax=Araneus ventricosus TaxID=182803 RepID=A0A4Y2UL90_ARAVE|nr:hypothetical protein AVEN_101557-1 [Araneus ventricosus]
MQNNKSDLMKSAILSPIIHLSQLMVGWSCAEFDYHFFFCLPIKDRFSYQQDLLSRYLLSCEEKFFSHGLHNNQLPENQWIPFSEFLCKGVEFWSFFSKNYVLLSERTDYF